MAIEDIFRALEEQAEEEVGELLRVAKAQAAAIEQESRDEASRITQARVAAAEEVVRAKAGKAVNAARLQAKRNLAAVRDTAVDTVFTDAAAKLAKLRGTPEYERVFAALAAEALAGIEGDCEMLVAPSDADLAARTVKATGASCAISPTLDTIGGLAVSYADGRVLRNNTFESRLAKVRGLAQAKVAEVLTS